MTAVIILIYALTAVILALGVFIGYKRGIGRAVVRLCYLAVIAVAAFFTAQALSGVLSNTAMGFVRTLYNETVAEAMATNPQLEVIISSLIAAVLTPVFFALLFGIVQLLSLICFKRISTKLVLLTKKELSPKASKWAGAGVGLVSTIVMIFVLFAPITFAASILVNTPAETLAILDEAFFGESEDAVLEAPTYGALEKSVPNGAAFSFSSLRAPLSPLGAFSLSFGIEGSTNSAQRELSNVLAIAGDCITAYNTALEEDPENALGAYLNVAATIGANTAHSEMATTLIKEASRAVSSLDIDTVTGILSQFADESVAVVLAPALPQFFEIISETPDEEIPDTFKLFFGEPTTEPTRTKEARLEEEKKNPPVDNKDDTTSSDEQTPTTPEQNPSTPEQNPSTPEQNPTTPEQNPTTPEQNPSTPEQNPTTPEQTPSTPEQNPSTPEQKPENNKKPTNSGLFGALLNGESMAASGEQLSQNRPIFELIKSTALSMLSEKADPDSPEFMVLYEAVASGLYGYLSMLEQNPQMTYSEKLSYLASTINGSVQGTLTEEQKAKPGMDFLLRYSSMEIVAIFVMDQFTLEDYPDKIVPIEDIRSFMGL